MIKLNITKIFYTLLLFISLNVFAEGGGGHGTGNGGDAVICYDNKNEIKSIELLDYWEQDIISLYSQKKMSVPLYLRDYEKLSVHSILIQIIENLKKFDTTFALEVGQIAFALNNNIENFLVNDEKLYDVQDAQSIVNPVNYNCKIKQFAIQWKHVNSGETRFSISRSIYRHPKTSHITRAGLLMHEAIYRVAILRGHRSSDYIRKFNYFLSNQNLDTRAYSVYQSAIETANLKNECQKKELAGGNYFYYKSTGNQKLSCYPFNLELKSAHIYCPKDTQMEFNLNDSIYFKGASCQIHLNQNQQKISGEIEFAVENQSLITLNYKENKNLMISQSNSKEDSYLCKRNIEFYSNGNLKSCYLAKKKLRIIDQIERYFVDFISLHENGAIKEGFVAPVYTIYKFDAFPSPVAMEQYMQDLKNKKKFPEIRQEGRWNVLGSKVSASGLVRFDTDMNLIYATLDEPRYYTVFERTLETQQLEVNGNVHMITFNDQISLEYLKRKIFPSLKFNDFIVSGSKISVETKLASLLGLESCLIRLKSKFLNISDDFYDLSNSSLVYKSIESVNKIESLVCKGKLPVKTKIKSDSWEESFF